MHARKAVFQGLFLLTEKVSQRLWSKVAPSSLLKMGLKTLMSADAPPYIKCLLAPPTTFTTTLPLPFFLNTWIFFFNLTQGCHWLPPTRGPTRARDWACNPDTCRWPRPFGMRVNALTTVLHQPGQHLHFYGIILLIYLLSLSPPAYKLPDDLVCLTNLCLIIKKFFL